MNMTGPQIFTNTKMSKATKIAVYNYDISEIRPKAILTQVKGQKF